ncbi:hypothetical protein [Arthrobacter sp. STN4]|uniref:hypothetical protein n=1 Tax=Arthrobacter sp. STN4 TaxID=2923276 RepID=UPI00211A7B00|nr:hypothetical protein [Arthrobacter sp. STN4]MCQ9163936.1 hypothetical protein [Arthrobacter sp. STN4]
MLVTTGPATGPDICSALCLADAAGEKALGELVVAGIVCISGASPGHFGSTYVNDAPEIFREMAQFRRGLGLEI